MLPGTLGRVSEGSSLSAQVTTLIHELDHVIGSKDSKPDAGDSVAGLNKDRLVDKNCRKLIEGIS